MPGGTSGTYARSSSSSGRRRAPSTLSSATARGLVAACSFVIARRLTLRDDRDVRLVTAVAARGEQEHGVVTTPPVLPHGREVRLVLGRDVVGEILRLPIAPAVNAELLGEHASRK